MRCEMCEVCEMCVCGGGNWGGVTYHSVGLSECRQSVDSGREL